MSKASGVYVVMLLVAVAGLWVILSSGSLLQAPEDLRGTWDLIPQDSPRSDSAFTGPLLIEQSGRYVNLRFGSGERMQMKLLEETDDHGQSARTAQLVNAQWHLTVTGLRDADEREMILSGEGRYVWTALRHGAHPASAAPTTMPTVASPTTQSTSHARD